MSEILSASDRDVPVSRPDKLLFPDSEFSKRDLAEYYRDILDTIRPHVENRPLTIRRFPDGISEDGFFQKNTPDYFPDWIRTETLSKEDGSVRYTVMGPDATLVYLADQAGIELHIGLSHIDTIQCPDRLVIDLDPPDGADFSQVQEAARVIREALDALGLTSLVMTTGSRGLHVVVMLDETQEFDVVREFATRFADRVSENHGDLITSEQRKLKRSGRVYLDIMRNAYGQTTVCPYSVRALPGAPIATPLDWDEALRSNMTPDRYHLGNIRRRLAQKDDPWADTRDRRQSLNEARTRLNG